MPEQDLQGVVSARRTPDGRAARRSGGKAMPAEVSAVVRAPKQTVPAVSAAHQNGLIPWCPDAIDLWEVKRRYDACFRNRFVTIPGGTLFVVTSEVWLKGWARLLRPFPRGHMRRLQLRPVQAKAEAQARRAGQGRLAADGTV